MSKQENTSPEFAGNYNLANAITTVANLAVSGLGTESHPAGGEVLIVPEGYRAEHLKPVDAPLSDHVASTVTLTELASLIAYVKDFKRPSTRVFLALGTHPIITAVLDYHGAAADGGAPDVRRCAHRAIYEPELDPAWQAWSAIDGKPQAQLAFAEFLEEHLLEIREPEGAAVLETVASLKAKKNVDFQSGVELQSGAVQLTYAEQIEGRGKGELEVPARLKLGMPIFFNGPAYEVEALLRYRIGEGKLTFVVKIHRREVLMRAALDDIVATFKDETGLAVHFGSIG